MDLQKKGMEGILTWNSLEYQRPATARMDCSSNGFGRCESMVQFAHLALVAWHMFFFLCGLLKDVLFSIEIYYD